MFSVLIPSFYAGYVHSWWMGLIVFVFMGITVFALNMWYMSRLANASDEVLEKEMNPSDPLSKLVTYRTLYALAVCLIIAAVLTEKPQ